MTSGKSNLVPPDESGRLAAVKRYDVLDTPRDGSFDSITRIASEMFGTPIAIISIVDEDRIWFKSSVGVDGVDQLDREPGLCASAILHDSAYVVTDAATDARTLANPLVAGEFGLRFYAASPLRTKDGHNLGTLCVIDREPRELTPRQLAILDDLASIVVDELELRLAARQAVRQAETRTRQAVELNDEVVQQLSIAKLSLELGEHERATQTIGTALESSKRILSDVVIEAQTLRRSSRAEYE